MTHFLTVPLWLTFYKYSPCSQSELLEDEDCLIMYDYSFFETKLILHDDNHIGTLEELNFEWDDRYVI